MATTDGSRKLWIASRGSSAVEKVSQTAGRFLASSLAALVHPLIHPPHAPYIRSWSRNLREISPMRGEVHLLSGLVRRHALRAKLCNLRHQILQVTLVGGNQRFLMERHPMSRQHRVEIELLQRVECSEPFIENAVPHIRQARFH